MATATKSRPKVSIKHEARVTKVVRDAAQETTNKIIAALEAGTVIWHKEWDGIAGLPTSLATYKPYQGSNVLVLWLTALEKGYNSLYWGTYKQMSERGGQVRKGEKSVEIIRPITFEREQDDGTIKKFHILRLFHVFNVDQCDWAEDARLPKVAVRTPVEAIEGAEAIVADYLATGPSLGHGGDRAYYQPGTDHIQLPLRDQFHSAEAYHSTKFHEAVHSTGHSSREARQGIAEGTFGAFGDAVYSNEELIAELGAAMLCAIAGIEQQATLDSSAAYLAHWIKALKGDKNLIIQAASAAQKAVNRIVGNLPVDTEEEES
jgi:antirestriction protein ArdC